jgi:hypothetical protein
MYMVERVTKMEFPKDVTHKPLKPNPVNNTNIHSPERESEIRVEEEQEEEEEEGGNWQQYQQQLPALANTGLTGGGLDSTDPRNPPLLSTSSLF